jgi:hypothetical protein
MHMFHNLSVIDNVPSFDFLHILSQVTFGICTTVYDRYLRAVLPDRLFIFSLGQNDQCISDHCNEKEIQTYASNIFIQLFLYSLLVATSAFIVLFLFQSSVGTIQK